jgi:hypothetical protein
MGILRWSRIQPGDLDFGTQNFGVQPHTYGLGLVATTLPLPVGEKRVKWYTIKNQICSKEKAKKGGSNSTRDV